MAYTLPPQAFARELVDFFWKFSVFECALKRAGLFRSGRHCAAEADWDRFAHEVQGRFSQVTAPRFRESVEAIERLAPRRQVVLNGVLDWEKSVRRPQESHEAYVLRLLRTARNNLFHGGKYTDVVDEIARNGDILRAASAILDGCHELHSGVKEWIDVAVDHWERI